MRRQSGTAGLAITLAFLGALSLAANTPWGATFELVPTDTEAFAQGPDRIRNVKDNTRERLEVEHQFGSVSGASRDNGLNYLGSARCFYQTTAPTVILHNDYDSAGGAGAATLNTDETEGTGALATDQVRGTGRCWVDTDGPDNVVGTQDDNYLMVYQGDPNGDSNPADSAWFNIKTGETLRPKNGAASLLSCGSWECMTVGNTAVPIAYGWAASNTPDVTYSDHAAASTEADGLYMTTSSNIADEGASFLLTGLKPSTTYLVIARVRATAGDTCSIRTTSASSNLLDTTLTTGVFETLTGTFTVDATPTSVNFIAESDTTSSICDWDHLAIYEQSLEDVPTPSPTIKQFDNTTDTPLTGGLVTYLTGSVTVPTNGYAIHTTGHMCAGGASGGGPLVAYFTGVLQQDVGGGPTIVRTDTASGHVQAGTVFTASLNFDYVTKNAFPGLTYVYTLQAQEGGIDLDLNQNSGTFGTHQDCQTTLTVQLLKN